MRETNTAEKSIAGFMLALIVALLFVIAHACEGEEDTPKIPQEPTTPTTTIYVEPTPEPTTPPVETTVKPTPIPDPVPVDPDFTG